MGCFCLKRLLVNQPNKSPRREIGDNGAAAVVLLRALERFEAKPKSEQEDILIYLSISWKDLQRDSSVIEALKETGFVTSADGDLYKPKDLFDPGDALLTSLFSGQPHKFPGERFVSDAWLSILRNTGLRNTHEADTVLHCARRIEFLGAESMMKHVGENFPNQVSLEIWSMAETLIETVLENSALLHDHNFCGVLVRPNTCVYIDPHGSQYVNYIDSLKLRFVHRDVSERLCLAFGIRKLSNVVVEELDYVEHLETLEEAGSVSLAAIRLKLLSRSFQVAVSSVVNNFSRFTSGFQNPDFLTLQRSLKSVAKRLKFVKCIYTRFRLLPKFVDITCSSNESFIPESKSGSSHRTLYYVDRSYTCMLIAKQPNYTSVVDLVAIVVSHVLGSPIPLPIGSLFLCPQDSETALVNILKLSSDERVIEGVGHGTGFLGGHLLPRDEKKVHCNRARFCKGEIVAWQSQDGEKLKYGRIPEDVRLKLSGRSSYRLKVEIFPGMTNSLINSRVFHFGYLTIKEDSSTLGMPVESDNILSGIQQPEASVGVNLRNQIHAITEHKLGRVPADVFDQSVEEMCSVSGINMDPEKQCLLQTTLSLHQWLNTQAALVLQQEKSEMATKEANTTKRALQCRICLSSEIDITLVPCGHVLCRACTSDITCCPICGVELSKPMRSMFVGDK